MLCHLCPGEVFLTPQIIKIAFDDLGLLYTLAAGVVAVAATAAVAAAHPAAVIAAATEQNQQNDDPAQIAATETVITHRRYLQEVVAVFAAHSKIFRGRKNVRRR